MEQESLEFYDLMEMANQLGRRVLTDHIDFSFYFSQKARMPHGIRVKIRWNREKLLGSGDGYMDLHGDYAYIHLEQSPFPELEQITKARAFFQKYKVLFAAVWEMKLQPDDVQDYLRKYITFDELKGLFEFSEDYFQDVHSFEEMEQVVRGKHLFDMND
jgi:hypothetical protein